MQRKIETFQVVPAENFRKEEVLYRFTRSKYFKCYGNLSVISFNFVNQLKAFAAVFFRRLLNGSLIRMLNLGSSVLNVAYELAKSQTCRSSLELQFGYSEQTGVISTSTRHFDFPPSGRLSRSPRTRWLAAQPRLRAAQRCVVVVLSDLPKRLRCQVYRILFISPRKGKEVQMYLPFSYVCNAFVQDQLRDLIFR